MAGKPYHHGDLRTQLVAAARSLIEAEGPEAVTLARLAAACGVSVAAPYRHFAGKEALLGEVAGEGFAELGRALAAAAGSAGPPSERLVTAGMAYVDYATSHPGLFRLMFSARLRPRQAEHGPAALAVLGELVAPVAVGVPADVAVRAAWALAHGLATLRIGGMLAFTQEDTEQRLREELRSLLTGIDGSAAAGRGRPPA